MRLYLLRHGETEWNFEGRCQGVSDLDLNERGKRQAVEIARYLSREKIDALYASDLKRALHTAEAIGQSHDLEVRVDLDFRELDHGAFEGLTFSEIRTSYPDFLRMWRSEPAELLVPGGERLIDVERRAWRGMEKILNAHRSDETVVVVSHQFPIATILCRITGTSLNDYRSFRVDPCALNRLDYNDKDGWKLSQMNHTGYRGLVGQEQEADF